MLEHLHSVEVTGADGERPFRFPVQWVNRPNGEFRGFSGTIVSGSIAPGDAVVVAGSGQPARVREIVTFDGTLANPNSGTQAITFTLAENSTLGSAVITASASITATGAMSGTYTLPAACGFPEDHGTISGYEDSTKFSAADVYGGTVDGNVVVVHFASVNGGVGASAGGTYRGATLALTGFASDDVLTLTGTLSGQETTWFALYDSLYNTFRIYDSDAKLIGGLTESP